MTTTGTHRRIVPTDSCRNQNHNLGLVLGPCRICHNADLHGRYLPAHRAFGPAFGTAEDFFSVNVLSAHE